MNEKNKISDKVTAVVLNEKTMSREEFEKKKQEVEEMKDAKVVEVKKDEYKTRLYD